MLIVMTVVVALFGLWWAVSYLYAYRRLRERLYLLQVGQGLVFMLMFIYITVAQLNQQPLSSFLVGLLILMAFGAGFVWRRRSGANILIQHYPRGMIDVLMFRKPAVDFKRRIRGK